MSKQWGHGFYAGVDKGTDRGMSMGRLVGGLQSAEVSFHCVNSAIAALVAGEDLQALTVLRLLAKHLEQETGRVEPQDKEPA